MSKRVTAPLALFFALNFFAVAAFAGVLGYGTPYTDGTGVTWDGVSHFSNTTSGLAGDVDWIVYAPGQFPYAGSGYTPPSDQYTYVYQIVSTGTVSVSDFNFSVDEVVGNISSFVSPGQVDGDLPAGIDFVSGQGGWVDWAFDGINGPNEGGNHTSAGLVFTSPKAPMSTSTGTITDGGTTGRLDLLPAPGTGNGNIVPEPTTLALALVGLGLIAAIRRFSRR